MQQLYNILSYLLLYSPLLALALAFACVVRTALIARHHGESVIHAILAILAGMLLGSVSGVAILYLIHANQPTKPMGDPVEGLGRMIVGLIYLVYVSTIGAGLGAVTGMLIVTRAYRPKHAIKHRVD